MAEIVLGIGTSHSPLLTFDAATWLQRAADDMRNPALALADGRTLSYEALLAERGDVYRTESEVAYLQMQAERANDALQRLADALEESAPDVALIIGDDQEELYKAGDTPSLAIFYGDEIVMRPLGEIMSSPPDWLRKAISAYAMDTHHRFKCAPAFALDLIERLMDKGVDLGVASRIADPKLAAFGHAYGFIARRLFRGREIPIVPVLLNTYYPPNVVRPARCYEVGRLIADAIAAIPGNVRVAVIASGGLSHFVTDADLDQTVLRALRDKDAGALSRLPMAALRTGSSEILCWVMAGGALQGVPLAWSDYLPVYRTTAGTGIGLAFAIWRSA
jgi:hypothetical protein